MDPRDRRDLACLGLMVLVYGLVVGPVVHAVVEHGDWEPRGHGHSHPHEHSHPHGREARDEGGHTHEEEAPAGAGHTHAWGSVEHLRAVAVTKSAVLAPVVWWIRLEEESFHGPLRKPGAPHRLSAMPQGP